MKSPEHFIFKTNSLIKKKNISFCQLQVTTFTTPHLTQNTSPKINGTKQIINCKLVHQFQRWQATSMCNRTQPTLTLSTGTTTEKEKTERTTGLGRTRGEI